MHVWMPHVKSSRIGAAGCLVATMNRVVQFPAYHESPINATPKELATSQDKVAKIFGATGVGKDFIGGFCIGKVSQVNDQIGNLGFMEFETAAIHGYLSGSFATEQVGVPNLTYLREDGKEL